MFFLLFYFTDLSDEGLARSHEAIFAEDLATAHPTQGQYIPLMSLGTLLCGGLLLLMATSFFIRHCWRKSC